MKKPFKIFSVASVILPLLFLNSYANEEAFLEVEFQNDLALVIKPKKKPVASELAHKWYLREDRDRTLQIHKTYFDSLISDKYLDLYSTQKVNEQPLAVNLLETLVKHGFYKEALAWHAIYIQKWHENDELQAECCALMLHQYVIELAELFLQKDAFLEAETIIVRAFDYYLKGLNGELELNHSRWALNHSENKFDLSGSMFSVLKYAANIKVNNETTLKETLLHSRSAEEISKVFDASSLFTETPHSSLSKFLASLVYYDSILLEQEEDCISIETLRNDVETLFNNILKEDPRTAAVLCAIALYAHKNPFYRIIFYSDGAHKRSGPQTHGEYSSSSKKVFINGYFDLKKLKRSLIHELTHQLMDVIYQNDSNPYYKWEYAENSEKYSVYDGLIGGLLHLNAEDEGINRIFSNVADHYRPSDYHAELIVRLPEAIVCNKGIAEQTKDLQVLYAFWDQYIAPHIDAFIQKRLSFAEPWMKALIEKECSGAAY